MYSSKPVGAQPLDAFAAWLIILRMVQRANVSGLQQAAVAIDPHLDRINIAVLAMQTAAWAASLALAPYAAGTIWLAVLIIFFCLMMQGVFSMMHECFHGHGHRNPRINTGMCWLATTIFGASATLIRINHLGHHVRNRTRAELVDFIEPGDSAVKKTVSYYFAIFGGIWLASFAGSLILLFMPPGITDRLTRNADRNTYSAAFADFTSKDFLNIRLEVLAGAFFWGTAFIVLDLQIIYVLIFYAAFAVSWSSLQWIYHVRTPLDVVEGTYNLRAPWFIRFLFLNFNYNLTHHRNPGIRWQNMHAVSDISETRPFWYAWITILKPPRPLPADGVIEKSYF